jgi:hypothetical protein
MDNLLNYPNRDRKTTQSGFFNRTEQHKLENQKEKQKQNEKKNSENIRESTNP